MDFLKEIVKEIGDDFTQLASDIDETERYVDTGSYIFNGLISGSIFGGVSNNKIPPLLVRALLERLFSPSQWLRTSLILILIVIVSILILKPQLIKDYLSLVELT